MRKLSLAAAGLLLIACGAAAVDAGPEPLPVGGDAGLTPAAVLDASAPGDAGAPDAAPACEDDRSPVSDACQVSQVAPDGGPCGTSALYVCESWDGGTRPGIAGCRADGPVAGGGLAWRCPPGCVRNARHEPAVCGDGGAYYSCAAGFNASPAPGCGMVEPAGTGSLVSVWCCR